jgi:hypothetical protein
MLPEVRPGPDRSSMVNKLYVRAGVAMFGTPRLSDLEFGIACSVLLRGRILFFETFWMEAMRAVLLLLAFYFAAVCHVVAEDGPPAANLARMMAQLGKKRPTTVVFNATAQPVDEKCQLGQFNVTLSRGPRSFIYSILSEPKNASPDRKSILAVIKRLKVDADGSPRAYHPEDPLGAGTCALTAGNNGSYVPPAGQTCAIDQFSDGGIAVFKTTRQLGDANLTADWLAFWDQIRDRKLRSIDLTRATGQSFGYSYYLFYWKEKDMTVFFKDENVQRTSDGYPCTRGAGSRYAGYFVAGTTLKHLKDDVGAETIPANSIAPPECQPLRNIDAERTPFFVIPGGTLGQATIGDIVVVRVRNGAEERIVYAIAADEGPISHFGEGSAALNQALLGKTGPIVNNHGLNALDIDDGRVMTVLILGGTKRLLNGDYSRGNVEAVGRAEFARWGGRGAESTERLNACIAQAKAN